ncbi:SRPBCC domain-containing protein [Rugamonas sp.]|uniref:SRPBCC family protein n=1 Tax=Rugamonas sp. TaxID=1926287 RepID=UPI0025EA67F9|nr:SRPBCC domain-containing protein [Rugamonas sp.]
MPDITHFLRVQASPEDVYVALTTTEGIRHWWTRDASVEAELGGTGEFAFHHRDAVTKVQVDELQPALSVGWTTLSSNAPGGWDGTTIHFELREDGAGTGVSFAHRGFEEENDGYRRVTDGWEHDLASLRAYLETGNGTPHDE